MRRTLIATTASVALFAAACGGDSGDSTSNEGGSADEANDSTGEDGDTAGDVSGDVTFWTYPISTSGEVDWWTPYVEEFNEDYPDVNVEVVVQPWKGREDSLTTAIAGGNAPDVVYFNPDFVPRFADEDLLLPLDDLRDDWDDFFDSSLEAMTWEDTLYGAPMLMQMSTSYCNTDALAAAEVEKCPTTWDELREAAPKFADAGYYATEYNGVATLNHNFYQFLWQAGGQVLSDDMQSAAFNSPEGLEALEFIKELVDNEWVPEEPLSVTEPVEQSAVGREEVGYIRGTNLVAIREVINPDIIEVAPPMQHKEQVAAGTVGGWSIFNTTDSPEAAKAWVRYLSNAEFIAEFDGETGYHPPRESVDGLFDDDPQIAHGADYLETVRVGVLHPKAREIIDVIRPHIQSVLLEDVDPQTALDAAEQEVNGLLARG